MKWFKEKFKKFKYGIIVLGFGDDFFILKGRWIVSGILELGIMGLCVCLNLLRYIR